MLDSSWSTCNMPTNLIPKLISWVDDDHTVISCQLTWTLLSKFWLTSGSSLILVQVNIEVAKLQVEGHSVKEERSFHKNTHALYQSASTHSSKVASKVNVSDRMIEWQTEQKQHAPDLRSWGHINKNCCEIYWYVLRNLWINYSQVKTHFCPVFNSYFVKNCEEFSVSYNKSYTTGYKYALY